jgi:hypothetical protein
MRRAFGVGAAPNPPINRTAFGRRLSDTLGGMQSNSYRAIKRALAAVLILLALVAALAPWALYELGLQGVEGRPQLPARLASQAEQAAVWQSVRGTGVPDVPRLNPYTFWSVSNNAESKAGVLLAWHVAANHLLGHRRYQGMHRWHLSGVALAIWLTRNWSTEQLLSKLAESQAQNAA